MISRVLCVVLISMGSCALAKESVSSLSSSLLQVKEVLSLYEEGEEVFFEANPLSLDEDFSTYESRFYLYLYQAVGFYFESLHFKSKEDFEREGKSLLRARVAIESALGAPHGDEEKILLWQENIRTSQVDLAFRQESYAQAEALASEALVEGSPGFRSEMKSVLRRVYKVLGKDEKELDDRFPDDEEETKVLSEDYLLRNSETLFKAFQKGAYIDEKKSSVLDGLVRVYPKIKALSRRTKRQKTFLQQVEKHFGIFSAEDFLVMAKALWRRSKPNYALFVLEKGIKLKKGESLYPALLMRKSEIYEDLRKYHSAVKVLEQVIALASGTSYHERALYRKAFISHLYLKKKSEKYFRTYLEAYPDGNYKTVSKYYVLSYESKKRSKFSSAVKEEMKSFFESNPISYYTFLLARNYPTLYNPVMKKFLEEYTVEKHNGLSFDKISPELQSSLACFLELDAFGLADDAYDVLVALSSRLKRFEDQILLVEAFKMIGRLDAQVIRSMRIFSQFPEKRGFYLLKETFPLFEVKLVSSVLGQMGIQSFDSQLVLSLIRQESAFNHKALSPVGARGLMQLMPGTAKQVAKAKGLEVYSLEDTKDNLTLGISYLKELMETFKGNKVYALSAYNAGPNRTKKWVKERGHMSSENFIEAIPYKETSLYVKLIMRNYLVYQMMNGERDFSKLSQLF